MASWALADLRPEAEKSDDKETSLLFASIDESLLGGRSFAGTFVAEVREDNVDGPAESSEGGRRKSRSSSFSSTGDHTSSPTPTMTTTTTNNTTSTTTTTKGRGRGRARGGSSKVHHPPHVLTRHGAALTAGLGMAREVPFTFDQLTVVMACHRAGSLKGAGLELGKSAAYISQTLTHVERKLEARIIARNGRSMEGVTAEGASLVAAAERVLRLSTEACAAVQDTASGTLGDVCLGASQTTGTYLMPRLLASFRRQHPGVAVRLTVEKTAEICNLVARGDLDAALIDGDVPDALVSRLHVTSYADDELVLVVPRGHPLAGKGSVRVEDLHDQVFVALNEDNSIYNAQGALLANAGLDARDLHVSMRLNSVDAIKTTVQYGLGVAFVSSAAVEKEVSLGLLEKVRLHGVRMARRLRLVTSAHGYHTRAARAFMRSIFNLAMDMPEGAEGAHEGNIPALRALSMRPWEAGGGVGRKGEQAGLVVERSITLADEGGGRDETRVTKKK